jgi:hypothetical protein
MAYSNAPSNDTYSSQRIPMFHDIDVNQGTDSITAYFAGTVNVLPFKSPTEDLIFGETRDSIYAPNTVVAHVSSTAQVRGFHVWEKSPGVIYWFVVTTDGTTSRVYSSSDGVTFAAVNTLGVNASTPVRFTEFIDATNIKKLVLVTGQEGYVFTTNAAGTQIVDADFPVPHVPFPVFIDGYIFLAKEGTGDIYNSDLNDPAVWTAGSFISSELYPDDIQALVKVDNYLLAIGSSGSEYFYDAANPTASPLARMEGSNLPFGTIFPNTVCANRNTVVFLANTNDGDMVYKVIEGTRATDLPASVIIRVLGGHLSSGTTTASKMRSFFLRQNGDLFYGLQFRAPIGGGGSEAVICNLKLGKWCRLGYESLDDVFPVSFTCPATSSNTKTYVVASRFFVATTTIAVGNMISGNANLDRIGSESSYITQTLVIPPQTFGTLNRKYMSRLGVYFYGTDSTAQPIYVAWSDQQSITTMTSDRPLEGTLNGSIANTNGYPFITQLGNFRSRMFKLHTTGQTKYRWLYLEVDINKGQQ